MFSTYKHGRFRLPGTRINGIDIELFIPMRWGLYCECQNNSSWRIITKLVCPVGKYKQPWKQLHFFAIFSRFLGAYLHTHPYTKELHCIDEHRDERTNRKMDRQIRDLDDLNWIKLRVTNKSKKNNSSNY